MRTKIFTIALWAIGFLWPVSAQENTFNPAPTNIQSPDAASLGRYGDFPVSYFSGTPDISIPLYEMNANGVTLPVTLYYDASGVKVYDHPGWVGQNWSLSAGGVITRVVQG